MYSVPADLRYTSDHEWARLEPDGRVTVGITDFAQKNLGDIVYVQLPPVGSHLKAGEPMGEIESPKAVSDIYSPVSGSCSEANPLCRDRPEVVNEDPYGEGWLIVVEGIDSNAFAELMTPGDYQAIIEAPE